MGTSFEIIPQRHTLLSVLQGHHLASFEIIAKRYTRFNFLEHGGLKSILFLISDSRPLELVKGNCSMSEIFALEVNGL